MSSNSIAGFPGHCGTTEYKYISDSRLNTVRVSDPVVITILFYDIKISSVSQAIVNSVSKISKYSL